MPSIRLSAGASGTRTALEQLHLEVRHLIKELRRKGILPQVELVHEGDVLPVQVSWTKPVVLWVGINGAKKALLQLGLEPFRPDWGVWDIQGVVLHPKDALILHPFVGRFGLSQGCLCLFKGLDGGEARVLEVGLLQLGLDLLSSWSTSLRSTIWVCFSAWAWRSRTLAVSGWKTWKPWSFCLGSTLRVAAKFASSWASCCRISSRMSSRMEESTWSAIVNSVAVEVAGGGCANLVASMECLNLLSSMASRDPTGPAAPEAPGRRIQDGLPFTGHMCQVSSPTCKVAPGAS